MTEKLLMFGQEFFNYQKYVEPALDFFIFRTNSEFGIFVYLKQNPNN